MLWTLIVVVAVLLALIGLAMFGGRTMRRHEREDEQPSPSERGLGGRR